MYTQQPKAFLGVILKCLPHSNVTFFIPSNPGKQFYSQETLFCTKAIMHSSQVRAGSYPREMLTASPLLYSVPYGECILSIHNDTEKKNYLLS